MRPPDEAEPDLDATTLQMLARRAGLELDAALTERLLIDVLALVRADRRLAAQDLGTASASGPPWGRPPDE